MKQIVIGFTDQEYDALLQYCAHHYFSADIADKIIRMLTINELVAGNFISQEDVTAGARLAVRGEPVQEKVGAVIVVDKPAPPPIDKKAKAKKTAKFRIPNEEYNGVTTSSYTAFKWLLNTMVDTGRFHSFTVSDVAIGCRMKSGEADRAIRQLATSATPWLTEVKPDNGGPKRYGFTEAAKQYISKNNADLLEAGIFDEIKEKE